MEHLNKCIVCNGTNLHIVYPATFSGDWQQAKLYFLTDRIRAVHGGIWRCADCGLRFTNPQFDKQSYARIYQSGEVSAKNTKISRNRFKMLKRFVMRYRRGGALLDVGCRDGSFLSMMNEFEAYGVDLAAGGQGASPRATVIKTDFLELVDTDSQWRDKFDVVTAWDFLEHVPDIDEQMEAIHRVLKPNGLLFCSLPNTRSLVARLSGRYWNLMLLEHLWYFNPENFTRFAARFGFEVLGVHRSCILGTFTPSFEGFF